MKKLGTALFLLGLVPSAARAEKAATVDFPNTAIALPISSKVSIEWVLRPIEKDGVASKDEERLRFDVDAAGKPWFGDGTKRLLLNPINDSGVLSSAKFDDFAFMDDGARVVCNDKYMGELVAPKTNAKSENGIPVLNFFGRVQLPHGDCRLHSAGPGAVYVVWHDEKSGRDEVSILRVQDGKMHATKLFSIDARITAVAGDGNVTYIGVEDEILVLPTPSTKYRKYFTPMAPVTGLAYSPSAGLFYTTPKSVGFVSPDFQMEPVKSPNPEIALRGDKLYVRLNKTLGVIRINGAERFQYLRWPTKTPPGAKSGQAAP